MLWQMLCSWTRCGVQQHECKSFGMTSMEGNYTSRAGVTYAQ
jgi:hypothetical protein